jgi:phosphopantothenoylcysteine synthetase/decarboxylase
MGQTRKLRGGATPIQIRAGQRQRISSKSGRQISRKKVIKALYGTPAAEYMGRIKKEAKEDVKALKKMDRIIREEEEKLKRMEENMEQINEEGNEEDNEAAEEDAAALNKMDREIREEEKEKKRKLKRETNKKLAQLFSGLRF